MADVLVVLVVVLVVTLVKSVNNFGTVAPIALKFCM